MPKHLNRTPTPTVESLETRDQPSTLAGNYLAGTAQQAFQGRQFTVASLQQTQVDLTNALNAAANFADPYTQGYLKSLVQADLFYLQYNNALFQGDVNNYQGTYTNLYQAGYLDAEDMAAAFNDALTLNDAALGLAQNTAMMVNTAAFYGLA